MALPNPSVEDYCPGRVVQEDRNEGEVTKTTTIWEDSIKKQSDGHQVERVTAGDLDNSPARIKLTDEDVMPPCYRHFSTLKC